MYFCTRKKEAKPTWRIFKSISYIFHLYFNYYYFLFRFNFSIKLAPKTQQSNQPIIKVNRKEELLMTNFTMNHYIEIHYTHVSFLLKEPLDQVKVLFPLDSLPGKLMMYSVLSLSFRKDGNLDFSENFLRYFIFFFPLK